MEDLYVIMLLKRNLAKKLEDFNNIKNKPTNGLYLPNINIYFRKHEGKHEEYFHPVTSGLHISFHEAISHPIRYETCLLSNVKSIEFGDEENKWIVTENEFNILIELINSYINKTPCELTIYNTLYKTYDGKIFYFNTKRMLEVVSAMNKTDEEKEMLLKSGGFEFSIIGHLLKRVMMELRSDLLAIRRNENLTNE